MAVGGMPFTNIRHITCSLVSGYEDGKGGTRERLCSDSRWRGLSSVGMIKLLMRESRISTGPP
jgi:hypothetical protein